LKHCQKWTKENKAKIARRSRAREQQEGYYTGTALNTGLP